MKNAFKFEKSADRKELPGGILRRLTKEMFPALKDIALNAVQLKPGAIREPHIHPNCAQLDYVVSGSARVGIIGPSQELQILDLEAGDLSYVPQGWLHWIENTGPGELSTLIMLTHELPETIEFSDMLSQIPNATLSKIFGVSDSVFEAIPSETVRIGFGMRD
jgi:oxalate decarboxylase/phosphoglucose isomerase-like protein (cupin superfamily)